MYYLIAIYLFVCGGAYAFAQTPLGRIANAVRDNAERAGFVGYDTRWVRYLIVMASSFFAGVAGGLTAINVEAATADLLHGVRLSGYLQFAFLGGVGFFFGPIIRSDPADIRAGRALRIPRRTAPTLASRVPYHGRLCAGRFSALIMLNLAG